MGPSCSCDMCRLVMSTTLIGSKNLPVEISIITFVEEA